MHLRNDPYRTPTAVRATSTADIIPTAGAIMTAGATMTAGVIGGAAARMTTVGLEFAQKAFIVAGDRLLLVRKSAGDPHHPERWEVPGGRLDVDTDTDLDDHIRREVWEEVGIKVDPGPPFHLWQWYLPDDDTSLRSRVVAVARVCRPVSVDVTTANQVAGDHIAAAAWVRCDRLGDYHDQLIPSLQPVMRHFLDVRATGEDRAPATAR